MKNLFKNHLLQPLLIVLVFIVQQRLLANFAFYYTRRSGWPYLITFYVASFVLGFCFNLHSLFKKGGKVKIQYEWLILFALSLACSIYQSPLCKLTPDTVRLTMIIAGFSFSRIFARIESEAEPR